MKSKCGTECPNYPLCNAVPELDVMPRMVARSWGYEKCDDRGMGYGSPHIHVMISVVQFMKLKLYNVSGEVVGEKVTQSRENRRICDFSLN